MKTKDKKKQAIQGLVPKLRFPKFQNAGEWTSKKLGKLSTILRGGSPRPIDSYLTNGANGLNWLKIGDVDKESKYIVRTEESVKVEALNKTRVVKPGDLILSNSMSFGRPYILKIETCIHDGWIAVTEITNKLNRDFLYYLILSAGTQMYFMNAAAGGGIKNLNANIIKQLPVSYPESEAEQQKIAICLSSLDELISAQAHKLNTLKAHKKGLMQKLFPAPGQTIPTIRFPEFRDTGAWMEVQLGSIAHFASGGTPSKSNPEYWGGTIPWISASSMYDINIQKSNLKITQYAVENGARMAPKGSLLILVRGSMLFNRVPIGIATVDVSFNQDVKALNLKKGLLTHFVLYQLLAFENRIPVDKTGIGAGKIELGELKRFIMFLPKDTNEQQKIADCLSSLDELIAAQAHKLDTLKAHKKGLMQQLFPNPDEVGG